MKKFRKFIKKVKKLYSCPLCGGGMSKVSNGWVCGSCGYFDSAN